MDTVVGCWASCCGVCGAGFVIAGGIGFVVVVMMVVVVAAAAG